MHQGMHWCMLHAASRREWLLWCVRECCTAVRLPVSNACACAACLLSGAEKKQRGALHHRRRESMKETCEREVCAGSEMRINVLLFACCVLRKEQSEGVRVK